VFIDPQIPEGITWAETTKETPYGTLVVNWHLEKDQLKLNIDVPVGCKAKVVIPDNINRYKVNRRTYRTRELENPSVAVIGSGKYSLSYSR
jgi:alpha-L-rhamnosidase